MFFDENAVIRPAHDAHHTRTHLVVLHSAHRDRARFPHAADFIADLDEPLLDVSYVSVLRTDIPEAAARNVRAGRNRIEFDDETTRVAVEIPPGKYDGPTLAAALQTELRRALAPRSDVAVRYDPVSRGLRIASDVFDARGQRRLLRVVAGPGLARQVGFADDPAWGAQRELAVAADLALDPDTARWRFDADPFAGLPPGAELAIRIRASGAVVRAVVESPRDASTASPWPWATTTATGEADVYLAVIRSDHGVRLPASGGPAVLSINGLRRIESPHAPFHAAFGVCRSDLSAPPMTKHMVPPLHMIRRMHVRLTDEHGDVYDLSNDDWIVELEIGTVRPGARAVPQFMVS